MNWNDVFECNSVDEAWIFFKCKFMAVIDGIAPVKEICVKKVLNLGCLLRFFT